MGFGNFPSSIVRYPMVVVVEQLMDGVVHTYSQMSESCESYNRGIIDNISYFIGFLRIDLVNSFFKLKFTKFSKENTQKCLENYANNNRERPKLQKVKQKQNSLVEEETDRKLIINDSNAHQHSRS